jgi:hypothetical protein
MNQTRIRLDQQFSQILSEEVDRRTVPKRFSRKAVRTTIAAAGTETSGLSNPGVWFLHAN